MYHGSMQATELAGRSASRSTQLIVPAHVAAVWSALASHSPRFQCNPPHGTEVRLKTVAESCLGSLGALHVGRTALCVVHTEVKYANSSSISLAYSRSLRKPAVTIGHKAWCNSCAGCKIEKPFWSAVNYKQTCAHSCFC